MSAYETVKNVFKVIYSPIEAFKQISQNPKYMGPILVMILFTAANLGAVYNVMSKTYVEQIFPTADQLDRWTENSTLWTASLEANVSDNYYDFINGTYYGNRSIQFSTMVASAQILMQLDNIDPVNCSGPEGYKSLYFRIKRYTPDEAPQNVTLYLFSTPTDYFHSNLTEIFSNSTVNVWNNLTILLESGGWLNEGNANWGNITGLKLEFSWLDSKNITLLIDGLFFGGVFKSPAENFAGYVLNFSVIYVMEFVIKWVLLGGILYIMTKAFKAKTIWKPLLILVGFALITMFIQALINAAAFSTLTTLRYPFEFLGGVNGEGEGAFNKILEDTWLVSQISSYVQIGIYIWTIGLCAIAARLLGELSWTKSFLLAAVAYFATLMIESFLLGY